MVASWVFGGLLVVFLMALVAYRELKGPKPFDPATHTIIGFLCATLAGLFAFFFTGTIAAGSTED